MKLKSWLIGGVTTMIVTVAVTISMRIHGADHRDAPLQLVNPRLDINDIYVFRSPEDANKAVLVITVHPILTPAAGTLFENSGSYELIVDRNGDLIGDMSILVGFSGDVIQQFRVEGLPGDVITGTVTGYGDPAPLVTQVGDVRVFCGPRDDPFFFDLDAFRAFTMAPYLPAIGLRSAAAGPPANFFGALDIAAIVIELPVTMLTGGADPNSGTVKIWSKTFELK